MKTVLIQIDALVKGRGYPIRLVENKLDNVLMQGEIAETWSLPPEGPGTVAENITPEDLARFVRDQGQHATRFLAMGKLLRKLVMDTPVGPAWQALQEPVRTVLDIRDPVLRSVPWELMAGRTILPLFADLRFPVVRGTPAAAGIGFQPPATGAEWPIRVLVVQGGAPPGSPPINSDEELAAVRRKARSFGRPVEVMPLLRPTKSQLRDVTSFFQPHVFHFIGHSADLGNGPSLLIFNAIDQNAGPTNKTEEITANDLSAIIADLTPAGQSPILRLAILNACRTMVASEDSRRAIFAISDAFVDAGVPAVLGTQADILGNAAALVCGPIYQAMASGNPATNTIDAALAKARQTIWTDIGSDRRDWSLPTLWLSVPPEQILPMPPVDPATVNQLAAIPEFKEIHAFIDREEPRLQLCLDLHRTAAVSGLMVITGETDVGKTSLLHYCLESSKIRGQKIAYLNMQGEETQTLLPLLRWIRDGLPAHNSLLCRSSLDENFFNRFTHQLNHLSEMIQKNQLLEPPDGQVVQDGRAQWPPGQDFAGIDKLLAEFGRSLAAAAEGRRLILAINDPKFDGAQYRNFLAPYLLAPIARREMEPVRMIMVVPESDREKYLQPLLGLYTEIPLRPLRREFLIPYAREFCEYQTYPLKPEILTLIDAVAQIIAGDWKPDVLRQMEVLIRKLKA